MTRTYNAIVAACMFVLSLTTQINAQSFNELDNVPHDISYFRESRITTPLVKVVYGRPSTKNDEKVFGDLVPYGEVWRTGYNEATEVKFYKNVQFGNTTVKAGTYVLYTIPQEKEWKVILSSQTDTWGAFQYNPDFNIAEITVPVSKAEDLETFSIAFKKRIDAVEMVLGWDVTRVKIPLQFEAENNMVVYHEED